MPAPRESAKGGVKGEHQQLMEAAVEGRADDAVALLRSHNRRTEKIIHDDPALFRGSAL